MKIGILGAGGLLGSTLAAKCHEKQIPFEAAVKEQADVRDLMSLKKWADLHHPTHIVNCAAYTNVDAAEREKDLAYAVNAEGAANAGRLCKELSLPLVHISTDYVFDGTQKTAYEEDDFCNPQNIYGKTKWEGELKLLDAYPESCILRTSWLFGKQGKNFISSIWQKMKEQETLKVVNDLVGKPTFVDDLAEVIFKMFPHQGIFHFANYDPVSRFQMAKDILEEMKKRHFSFPCKEILPISASEFPTPAKRPPYSVLSTAKIEQVLAFKPRSWKNVLQDYLKCL
jgi:dTDP-4-dehydrorhamnose reductase